MIGRRLCLGVIHAYRWTLSPLLQLMGVRCRHEPSCSAYGVEAFRRHPPRAALVLTVRRVASCRPGGTSGYDPVPERLPSGPRRG